ncbi:MAG: twin-arginine translocation signal domain-containing protein [Verrucomicrobiaceae bacterium]|nr:MAG: twin-arginine translocation signal domain-containing protein [Verrucomicrobiaceae bacterium]
MIRTRRDFLKLAGLTAASAGWGCAPASSSSSSASWSSRDLEALRSIASSNGARGWAAWQGSRQVAAWQDGSRGPSLSITKSIAALAATRAAGEGWLDPSERVCDTLPEWRSDPQKSRITVLMLLQQTSGLEAGVIPLYRNQPVDKGRAAVALRCVDSPGTVFRYGPGHWETLAEVMRRKLSHRGETLPAFMNRAVMRPVGLSPWNWRADRGNNPYFSTGTQLDIRELGRLGRTISGLLAGKNHDGFSAGEFVRLTRPSSVNPMFGGGLWRNTRAGRPGAVAIQVERNIDDPRPASFWNQACLSNHQPPGFVALIGSGGRRVYLWPDQDRRIARLGSSPSWSDAALLARV